MQVDAFLSCPKGLKMSRIKMYVIIAAAVLTGLIVPATASALPDISLTLPGSTFPLHLNFADNGKTVTELQSASGAVLTGAGLSLLLLIGELTALGTFRADFLNNKRGTTACHSIGDAAGVILMEGSFHVVYTSLSPLTLGILYLPKFLELECGTLLIELKGSMISSFNGIGTEGSELTTASGQLAGTKGKANIKTYYNDAGTSLTAKLESNDGAGFVESNEIVEGEPVLTALGNNMWRVTSR
jgi:hypothetical protein